MSEWTSYRIQDVAEVFDGPHATPTKTADGPWFLSISSLKDGRLDLKKSAHISEEDFRKWTRRVTPRAGDVLFSYETRLGQAAWMPAGITACLGRRMALIRPRAKLVDSRFLLYAYLGPDFQSTIRQRTVRGATVDRIPLVDLPSWPIKLPSLPEQRKIALLLGALDDKIAVNERIAIVSLDLATAHYSAETTVEEGLQEVRIGEIVDIFDGPHATPKKIDKGPWFLSISSLNRGRLDLDESAHVSEEDFIRWTRRIMPQPGDVLFSYETRLGEAALMPAGVRACLGRRMALMRPREGLDPAILLFAYLADDFQETIRRRAVHGATVDRIPLIDLPSWPIELPVARVARPLGELLGALNDRAVHAMYESRTLAELRDTLLPKLMSGELRVKQAEKMVEQVV